MEVAKTMTIDGKTFFTGTGAVEYIGRTPGPNGQLRPLTTSGLSYHVYNTRQIKVALKLGKNVLFAQSDLDAFIAGRGQRGIWRNTTRHYVGKRPKSAIARGAIIRQARHARNWSQAELARQCGTSRQTVCYLETGRVAGFRRLTELARVLGLDATQLAV